MTPEETWHVRDGYTVVAHLSPDCPRIRGVETEQQTDKERRENGLRKCSTCGFSPALDDVEPAQ